MAKLLLSALLVAAAVGGWGWGGVAAQEPAFVPIHFGEHMETPMPMSVISQNPPSCVTSRSALDGDTCLDDPEYNERLKRHITFLIQRDAGINALLKDPRLSLLLNDTDIPSSFSKGVDTRVGVTVSETPVCEAQETLIYPKRAKTPREDWVFVVNQEDVQQALRVEKCISDGTSCNIGMSLPGGVTATCRQKYVYRRMLVLGTNKIEPEEVLMPSCCVCYTTYNGFLTRSRNASLAPKPVTSSGKSLRLVFPVQ